MSRYFTDLPIIKEERMRHWYETEARLMKANPKKKIPCPYLFLEKGDLAQFDGFIELVKIMREKMLA